MKYEGDDSNTSYEEPTDQSIDQPTNQSITPGNNQSGDSSNNQQETYKYAISGTVWEDINNNGSRDSGEELTSGVKVYAIDVETNKLVGDIATTNNEGFYTLSLPKGEYIVAFEYDTSKYIATKYQVEGVSSDRNSDAVKATKVINGEQKTLGITDSIKLDSSIANIDLGIVEAKTFSLELEKVISKMIVTNSEGSKTYNFEDTNLAKVEIAGKNLNSSNVVIEYKIKVTNKGEIAGYAKSIVDYVPSSLTFNSSLNKDWYKKENKLYTAALADKIIEPGETKEVKLILTKKMTESNTGLTNNKAEIMSTYNSLGIDNSTSRDSKNISNDENKKSADAIVGVKTGSPASYTALALTIVIIIFGVAYLINKKLVVEKIEI